MPIPFKLKSDKNVFSQLKNIQVESKNKHSGFLQDQYNKFERKNNVFLSEQQTFRVMSS